MSERLVQNFASILEELGEDRAREGLRRTPERAAESLAYLTGGYTIDPFELLREAQFDSSADELVLVKDIQMYSLCEHHILPFYGKVHVGYIPAGRILGLSKVARVVDCFARRLQVQENLTDEIADTLMEGIGAAGVGVVIEATHLCMAMRGVHKSSASMRTVSLRGVMREAGHQRAEFLSQV